MCGAKTWILSLTASLVAPGSIPCQPVGRGAIGKGLHVASTSPLAHTQQRLEFRAEISVKPAVDEGVVTRTAHSKPVEGEVQGIVGVDGLAGDKHHVTVQGKPTNSKHHDHHH